MIIFIGFNKFKCTSRLARHTHSTPTPQSLKSNPKGIHPTPRQPSLSESTFKCSKQQTVTPCPPSPPPLSCAQHLYFSSWLGTIKCSWAGSSHPDRQVLKWVWMGRGGGGLCRAVRTAAKQLFAGHPDGVCSQRGTLVGALKPAPFYFGPVAFFLGECCSPHIVFPSHICPYIRGPLCEPGKYIKYHSFMWNNKRLSACVCRLRH